MKDPAYAGKHTAEVLALCDARTFEPSLRLSAGERPEEYLAVKAWVEERMLAQFRRHFPQLAPMLRFHELSTPVTQQRYVRTPDGAMYGIEMTPQRLSSRAGGTGRIRCRHAGSVHERNAGGRGAGTLATAAVGRLTVAQVEGRL